MNCGQILGGRASLETAQEEIAKLERVHSFHLPPDLFAALSPQVLRGYRQRVVAEEPHELRRHPTPLRATLLAGFCHLRGQEITDNLVDLLIDTVHRIGTKAEQRVERELIEDLKRVSGKNGLLFQLAEATLAQADGIIREVVFPVVDEQTLQELVREWKAHWAGLSAATAGRNAQLLSFPLPPDVARAAFCTRSRTVIQILF